MVINSEEPVTGELPGMREKGIEDGPWSEPLKEQQCFLQWEQEGGREGSY